MNTAVSGQGRWREPVCLGLITLLGGALRFWRLDYRGLWYDEFCAWYSFSSGDLLTALRNVPDVHSPGFALIMALLHRAFPFLDDYSVRVAPALLGVMSVPLLYAVSAPMVGRAPAMLASMFLAIAPIHIELSRQVVMYTLMLVGVLLAVHFLYQAHERSVRSWGLAGFFVACTLYAHPFGAFPLAMVTAGLAADAIIVERAYRRVLAYGATWFGATLAYAPWLVYRIRIGKFTGTAYEGGQIERETLNAYDHFRQAASWIWQGDNWSGSLTAPLCVFLLALGGCALVRWRENRRALAVLVPWSLTPLAVYALCSLYGFPAYSRYLMPVIPATALLLAMGFCNLLSLGAGRAGWRYAAHAAAALVLSSLLAWDGSVIACQFLSPQSTGFRPLGRVLAAEACDNTHVVVTAFDSYAPHASRNFIHRYAPALDERVYVERPDTPYALTERFLAEGKTVWYVVHGGIPEKTRQWLRSQPSVTLSTVGNSPIVAALLIPAGAFQSESDRDRYLAHVRDTELAVYRRDRFHTLIRFGDETRRREGDPSRKAYEYYSEALDSISLLRKLTPFSAQTHTLAGEALHRQGNHREAIREYRIAASLEFGKDKERLEGIARELEAMEATMRGDRPKE